VYDLDSPIYQRNVMQLQAWVEQGGKLLFWDVKPVVATPPFFEGLLLQNDSSYETPNFVRFRKPDGTLLLNLSGGRYDLDPRCGVTANIAGTSQDWQELADTVVGSVNMDQIQWGYNTFGPRWTSNLNSARRPLLLTKKLGEGQIVLAEMGSCNILPAPGMKAEKTDQTPLYLGEFANNIFRWSQESTLKSK
jgi:hypothetical protein